MAQFTNGEILDSVVTGSHLSSNRKLASDAEGLW